MNPILLGTVVTVSPFTVRVDGSTVPAPARRLATYTPTAGDRIVLAVVGPQIVALARLV